MSNLGLLEEEIDALSQLSHPSVCHFTEVVESTNPSKDVVMEYCERGRPQKVPQLPLGTVLRLIRAD